MNRVILSGRIARDIDFKSLVKADGTTSGVANFSIACSRGKDDVDFINVSCFGKTADMVSKYFSKGSGIEIEGSIRVSNYTNKDGQKIYRTDVWVERVEFPKVSKTENNGGQNNAPQYNAPPQNMNDPNLPFNNAPQTGGYAAPTQTPAQSTQQNGFYTNAPAQPTPNPTPAPAPQPTPTPPVTPAQQNPYNPYGGGWQNDFASAPFN